jgi:hypothetical protein
VQAESDAQLLREEAERQRQEWKAAERAWRRVQHAAENHYADHERRVDETLEDAQKRAREAEQELDRVQEDALSVVSDTIIAPNPFTGC